jgi:aspartyl-tRNA(Asn)/glutamyl-tRNA(Gln) amidotransferase subunit A
LAGVCVGIKDVIDVEGLPTRCGSRLSSDEPCTADADVVAGLRSQGAVVLGKTTTHEYAYGPTGDVTATGPVRNPHDPARMSGGSSAGSAAALGAGIITAALGTDTGGSGRTPAGFCGVVGLRPTSGSVRLNGVFPLAPSLDVVSPMATDVFGVQTLWEAIRDVTAPGIPAAHKNLRIGRLDGGQWSRLEPAVLAGVERAAAALTALGHNIQGISGGWAAQTDELYQAIQGPEAAAIHHQRLVEDPEGFQPEVLERLRGAEKVAGWEYVRALNTMAGLRADLDRFFGDADVLLCATSPVTAPRIGQREGFAAGWKTVWEIALAFTAPFSVLGCPALSVPAGADEHGMPVGVQLVGRHGTEETLLTLGATMEGALTRGSSAKSSWQLP